MRVLSNYKWQSSLQSNLNPKPVLPHNLREVTVENAKVINMVCDNALGITEEDVYSLLR